jgi:hypothetical protein
VDKKTIKKIMFCLGMILLTSLAILSLMHDTKIRTVRQCSDCGPNEICVSNNDLLGDYTCMTRNYFRTVEIYNLNNKSMCRLVCDG